MAERRDDEARRDDERRPLTAEDEAFHRAVVARERRARKAKEEGDRTLRYGFGSFGAIGWSIVVPSLIGIFVGLWLDRRFETGMRFTLSLFVLGLFVGIINVWKWMNAE